jgi:hypothetical protein
LFRLDLLHLEKQEMKEDMDEVDENFSNTSVRESEIAQ